MSEQKPPAPRKKGKMDWYFKSNLLVRIFLGLILGAVIGLIFGDAISWLQPFGDLFIRLLTMIVMPIIIATLVVGAASISPATLGKVGIKIVLFYLLTSAFAVFIGLLSGNIFRPGRGLDFQAAEGITDSITREAPSFVDTLLNLVPRNVVGAVADGNVLPVIFFAILFGIGISYLKASKEKRVKDAADVIFKFFDATAEVMYLIVGGIMQYAPIGVFALIAVVFGDQGAEAAGPLGVVTFAAYLGYIVHIVVIYGGLLTLNKLKAGYFFKSVRAPMVTAFVTRSSGGTLPISMKAAEENLGVHKNVYSFTLPLGATINMDGTAIYQGVCAIFIGIAIGAPLTIVQQLTVILTAVLASIGTAGVPGAGAIMLLMVLNSVGMPVEPGTAVAAAYAMILGIDAILDMGRTCVNVTGDLTGSTLVAKSEKELDTARWG